MNITVIKGTNKVDDMMKKYGQQYLYDYFEKPKRYRKERDISTLKIKLDKGEKTTIIDIHTNGRKLESRYSTDGKKQKKSQSPISIQSGIATPAITLNNKYKKISEKGENFESSVESVSKSRGISKKARSNILKDRIRRSIEARFSDL